MTNTFKAMNLNSKNATSENNFSSFFQSNTIFIILSLKWTIKHTCITVNVKNYLSYKLNNSRW